jgi:hypothetical protein
LAGKKPKESEMIDVNEGVLSGRTVRATKGAPQSSARFKPSAKISPIQTLPVPRVFSDAKVKPFDQIAWDRQRQGHF